MEIVYGACMTHSPLHRFYRFACVLGLMACACAHATTVTLEPSADATIHSASNGIEEAANGVGPWNFSGWTTRFGERRALIRFDVASVVPSNATITAATLTIHVDRGIDDGNWFGIHRVTSAWNQGPAAPEEPGGEGAEPQSGDVTWTYREYSAVPGAGVAWVNAGGDYVAQASSSVQLSRSGAFVFPSTSEMVADVSAWLQHSQQNHGWIVIATETMLSGSAKRFGSRESSVLSSRPVLTLTYTTCQYVDFNNDEVFPDDRDLIDFFAVLAGGDCATCNSIDFNGDGVFPDDRDITAFFSVLAGGQCE